jgi:predicted dehydrogenase
MAREMAAAAKAVPGLVVAAVLSRDKGRAAVFCAEAAPGAVAHDDMVAFLGAVEAVYIATPPDQHLAAIEAALGAGRPVLCEKPLTPDPQDTARAIALAREKGVALVEAVWTLALPAFRVLAAQVDSLADPGGLRMSFDFSYPIRGVAGSHYLDPATGGVLLDRAVYGYGAALRLLGPVRGQQAFISRDSSGLDRGAEIRLDHDSGARSVLTLSFDILGGNRLEVASSQGLARLGPPSLAAEILSWEPFHDPAPGGGGGGGLKAKLKTLPLLRKLNWKRMQARGQFLDAGAPPYAALLQEFDKVVANGAGESAMVPLAMSAEIAGLVAEARLQGAVR